MTLNDLEWCPFILRYCTEFDCSAADYGTVVEDGPVMFAKYYIWPKLTHAAVGRSLCDS